MSLITLLTSRTFGDWTPQATKATAGFSVDLSGDLAAARDMLALPSQIVKAQQRALGTLARKMPVQARRDIQTEYRLKAARIRKGLRIRSTEHDIRLVGSARGINAEAFGATWSPRKKVGARYSIKVGTAPYQHKGIEETGTFMATGLSNNHLVWYRVPKKRRYSSAHYAPNKGQLKDEIRPDYGPSIGQMLKHGKRPERLANFAGEVIRSEIDRQLDKRTTTP